MIVKKRIYKWISKFKPGRKFKLLNRYMDNCSVINKPYRDIFNNWSIDFINNDNYSRTHLTLESNYKIKNKDNISFK